MARARLRSFVLASAGALGVSACGGEESEFTSFTSLTLSGTGTDDRGDDDDDGTGGSPTGSGGTSGGASADGSTSLDPSAEGSTSIDPGTDSTTDDPTAVESTTEDPAGSSSSTGAGSTTAAAVCGDGVADPGEDCDMADLAGQDCNSLGLGFDGGVLGCTANCVIDTTDCVVGGGSDSCAALCGQPYDRTLSCQCDSQCLGYGDCCADICPMCDAMGGIDCEAVPSCVGLCGNPYDDMAPCQCDSECAGYGDCCDDICPQCDGVDGVAC